MKIGKDTGSLVNWLDGNSKGPKPEIGMGVTFLHWSDRSPGTIIEILDNGYIAVQADKAKRIDKNGFSEMQEYEYTPDPAGAIYHFRIDKTGRWEGVWRNPKTNRWSKTDYFILVGKREKYHDFSF